jgi:CRISPR-associated protein Csh1
MKGIGEYIVTGNLTPDIFLEKICQPLVEIKPNKENSERSQKQLIVFLNFNTNKNVIEFDFESINAEGKDSKTEFLWIGDSIRHKLYCPVTTRKLDRLLTTTISELIEASNEEIPPLKTVLHDFFNKIEFKAGSKNEILYFIRPDKFEFSEDINQELKNISDRLLVSTNEQEIKKQHEALIKSIQNSILNSLNLTSMDISLFTLKVDGQLICQTPQYKKMIYDEKIGVLFGISSKYQQRKAICSICSCSGLITTSDSTNFKFKLYMRDKVSFSSNFDGKFTKNYNICKDCYQHLLIAENFIATNLRSKIGGLDYYIIPHIIIQTEDFDFEELSKNLILKTNSIANLTKFEKNLIKEISNDSSFVINYLFYYSPSGSNEFKALKLIKDVPPSRLSFIQRCEEEIMSLVNNKFEGNSQLIIDLNKLWSCIPSKEVRNNQKKVEKYIGTSRYLEVVDSIFSGNIINVQFLISQFNEAIRILKYERDGYNIKISDNFALKMLQLNLLLLFFKRLNLIEGLKMSSTSKIDINIIQDMIPEQILDYWDNLEIYEDNQRKALFLLGYMIGEVGISQSSKEIKNKPILDKINFQGMSIEKLIRLANEIPEKLRQYGKLSYNENINTAFRILFESNIEKWKLSNQENVFYVLSGYSYSNYVSWIRYKKSTEDLLLTKSEIIDKLKHGQVNTEIYGKLLTEAKNLIYGERKDFRKARELLTQISIDDKKVEP